MVLCDGFLLPCVYMLEIGFMSGLPETQLPSSALQMMRSGGGSEGSMIGYDDATFHSTKEVVGACLT